MTRHCIIVLFFAALLSPVVVAQEERTSDAVRFGNHAFRFILNEFELSPIEDADRFHEDPKNTVVIVFGDTSVLHQRRGQMLSYLRNGGSLLLATDRPLHPFLAAVLGVRISGKIVETNDPRRDAYKGLEELADCPLVRDYNVSHPVFKGLTLPIACNRPSSLQPTIRFGASSVATFPPSCWQENRSPSFAVVSRLFHPRSRLLILSDHSVFINAMMMQDDNANFTFAFNCIHWLSEGGKRKKVLFVDEGTVWTDFEVASTEIPDLPADPVAMANLVVTLLDRWQKQQLHNRIIYELFGQSNNRVWTFAAIVMTGLMLGYMGYRMVRARSRSPLFQ
ncbi:MAG: hypothetical protein KatS3mg105_4618 [Gemmatales bacterium]|nr:MAG: hypothetical protein KatS3mg105_4618 [Gemmatales bacterium]